MTEDDWGPEEVLPVSGGEAGPVRRPGGLRYLDAYRFIFSSPHWGMNVLSGVLCHLVPVIGPLVFLGYGYEIVEALHLWGDRRYPDFDSNRLLPYMKRGVWPFLVGLIVGVVVGLLVLVGYFVAIMLVVAGTRTEKPETLLVVAAVLFLALLGVILVLQLLVSPLVLRAGLSQELALSGALGFVGDFLRRTWKELLLGELFLLVSGLFLGCAGLLLCYVGVYPALVLISLAHQHLLYQLYQVYLGRGGTPILLKPPEPERRHYRW